MQRPRYEPDRSHPLAVTLRITGATLPLPHMPSWLQRDRFNDGTFSFTVLMGFI
jgi:hypothetical protein